MFFLLFSSFTFFTFWSLARVWFFGSAGCWTWEGHVHLHFSCIGFWSVFNVVLFLVLISTLWNILARYGSVWECHLDPHFSWIDFSSENYQMNADSVAGYDCFQWSLQNEEWTWPLGSVWLLSELFAELFDMVALYFCLKVQMVPLYLLSESSILHYNVWSVHIALLFGWLSKLLHMKRFRKSAQQQCYRC